MKRFFRFAALLLPVALLVASCAKEFGSEEGGPRRTYDFVGYLDSSTKTDLDDGGHTIWKSGDQVHFYTEGVEKAQTRTVDADGSIAKFGEIQAMTYVNAVYGASASQWGDFGFILSDAVKPSQDGTFGDAHVSVANTLNLSGGTLYFKNLTSMLKFTIQRPDVKYVRVISRTSAQLYGDVQVVFNNDTPDVSWAGSGGSTIQVSTENGNGVYYLSLLPGEYKDGFEFRCYDESGNRIGAAISRKTLSLPRNSILDLGVLENYFAPEPDDLGDIIGTNETSNCYIAPKINKEYKFLAIYKGNSKQLLSFAQPDRAEVLWETYGTSENPVAGTVVSDVSYSDRYVYLTALRNGSAIIAVRDKQGKILWSWHIWVWDGYDIMTASQQYYNSAGSLMDRNLGASSATIGEDGARGFMYQWGRKDPILGATSAAVSADNIKEKHTLIASSAETGTIQYAIEHPMTFIYYSNQTPGDWLADGNSSDDLWTEDAKSMYDPCPPGWRMPESDFWTKAFKGSAGGQLEFTKEYNKTSHGIDFAGDNNGRNMGQGPFIWYPGTGYRDGSSASNSIQWIQFQTFLWTAGTRDNYGVDLAILGLDNAVKSSTISRKASGLSVRCKLDYTPPVIEATGISLDKPSISMMRYESAQLTATVIPSYAASTAVHWETSNSSVATVTSDGVVTGAGEGSCVITAYASKADGTKNPDVKADCTVSVSIDQENLLAPANCFIVDKPGQYRFDASIKGNGSGEQTKMQPYRAKVRWMTFGDSVEPDPEDRPVIENVKLESDNTITFEVPSPMRNGNALIVAMDDDANVLWSWHIWACLGYEPVATQQVYNLVTEEIEYEYKYQVDGSGNLILDANHNPIPELDSDGNPVYLLDRKGNRIPVLDENGNPKVIKRTRVDGPVFMDRNLGATSVTKGDVHTLGLLYQWGRKDPFIGPKSITSGETAAIYGTPQNNVVSTSTSGTIDYSVKHPTTFILGAQEKNYDWLYTTDHTLWGEGGDKTIYDPCPAGWRVPKGGDDGDFARAFMPKSGEESKKIGLSVNHTYDIINLGMDLSGEFGSGTIWYPFAAYRTRGDGNIGGQGQYSHLWTNSVARTGNNNGYMLTLNYMDTGGNGTITLNTTLNKSYACSIRCVKE